jgi:hypothetical protein
LLDASSSLPERKWAGRAPPRLASRLLSAWPCSRVGFAEPARSPWLLVRSYRTVSPLPGRNPARRFVFCGTFPGLAAGRSYRPPCPVEPGLSSRRPWAASDHPLLCRRLPLVSIRSPMACDPAARRSADRSRPGRRDRHGPWGSSMIREQPTGRRRHGVSRAVSITD